LAGADPPGHRDARTGWLAHRLPALHRRTRPASAAAHERQQRRCAGAHHHRPLATGPMTLQEPLGLAEPWPAPAKLNLCLHIIGRRPRGYHLLQSAIQFIDLCDELYFYKRADGLIERLAGPADIPPEDDLVVRAARLLAARYEVVGGVGIDLRKRIPQQA